MPSNAYTVGLFPGQASQYVGMGKDLHEKSSDVKALYKFASDTMGEDLGDVSFNGPQETLKRTRYTQPAILTHSLAALTFLEDQNDIFDAVAGHSLGEYGALVAAGCISAKDAIKLVITRASLMEDASQNRPGTMAAVMGMQPEELQKVCDDAASVGIVVMANMNLESQIVISGEVQAVERASELAKERGAKRAIMLEVGGAFHSPLMQSARDGMHSALAKVDIKAPKITFVPNVTARPEKDPEAIRQLLVEQITSPVRWAETQAFFKSKNATRTIEVGPKKVLTSMAKSAIGPEDLISLDTLEDIERFLSPVESH